MNSSIGLSCSFLGNILPTCIWNASGPWCSTESDLLRLDGSRSAIILSKSCTLKPREGNPSPRYSDIPQGSINSMGLPNLGVDFYLEFPSLHSPSKPYIISVGGLSYAENIAIISKIEKAKNRVCAVELNLSCPNLIGKPQIAYDPKATRKLLDGVFARASFPIGIKLPPYFDMAHFEEMAKVIEQYPIAFITAINSIGNALYIDPTNDRVVIKPKNGFGGLGGFYIKPTAIANVRKWRELTPSIPIVGCGGIYTGRDIYDHLLCGATAVQIGTAFMQKGVDVFKPLEDELKAIMKEKSYASIDDFRGKLKFL